MTYFVPRYPFVSVPQKQPPEVFCNGSVLKNFTKFTGKHLCQGLFFNKVAEKRDSGTGVFSVNFVKFLRTSFSQNTPSGYFLCHHTKALWFPGFSQKKKKKSSRKFSNSKNFGILWGSFGDPEFEANWKIVANDTLLNIWNYFLSFLSFNDAIRRKDQT